MKGADCNRDHNMIMTTSPFSIENQTTKEGSRPPSQLIVTKLNMKANRGRGGGHVVLELWVANNITAAYQYMYQFTMLYSSKLH